MTNRRRNQKASQQGLGTASNNRSQRIQQTSSSSQPQVGRGVASSQQSQRGEAIAFSDQAHRGQRLLSRIQPPRTQTINLHNSFRRGQQVTPSQEPQRRRATTPSNRPQQAQARPAGNPGQPQRGRVIAPSNLSRGGQTPIPSNQPQQPPKRTRGVAQDHQPKGGRKRSKMALVPEILIFTDFGHDFDDPWATAIAAHWHNKGRVKIVGIVTQLVPHAGKDKNKEFINRKPGDLEAKTALARRAATTLGFLVGLGAKDIPVAIGNADTERPWPYHPNYEYDPTLAHMSRQAESKGNVLSIEALAYQVFNKPRTTQNPLRILVLTNFQRLNHMLDYVNWQFGNSHFDRTVSEIHAQNSLPLFWNYLVDKNGNYVLDMNGERQRAGLQKLDGRVRDPEEWAADVSAANTMQDIPSARKFFQWSKDLSNIQIIMYSKGAMNRASFGQADLYRAMCLSPGQQTPPQDPVQRYLWNVHRQVAWEYWVDCFKEVVSGRGKVWYGTIILKLTKEESEKLQYEDTAEHRNWYFTQAYPKIGGLPYDPIATLGCIREAVGWNVEAARVGVKNMRNKFYVGENMPGADDDKVTGVKGVKWMLQENLRLAIQGAFAMK